MTATPAMAFDDRIQICELLTRYYAAIDDRRLDRAAVDAAFTADGRWVGPTGVPRVGGAAIAAQQLEAMALFRATHHVISDHLIEVDGDRARVRANLTAMHLWAAGTTDPAALESHFLAGGVFEGQAERTSAGWRVRELTLRITWRQGALPVHIRPNAV